MLTCDCCKEATKRRDAAYKLYKAGGNGDFTKSNETAKGEAYSAFVAANVAYIKTWRANHAVNPSLKETEEWIAMFEDTRGREPQEWEAHIFIRDFLNAQLPPVDEIDLSTGATLKAEA